MNLCDALLLRPGAVVAIVGAGGKTATMERLAVELAARSAAVVCTTTTAIWEPAGPVIMHGDEGALIAAVAAAARPGIALTVAAGRIMAADAKAGGKQRPKLVGVAPHLPGLLAALPSVDYVLVEADGARSLSIKAPAAHEPVIPPAATVVVALAGIDALGRPLGDEIAHRPELIAALLGIALGTTLGPGHIAAVLSHSQGGRKGVPAQARFVCFINKVENAAALHNARAVASCLRGLPGVDQVLLGAALAPQPVLEVW